MLSFGRDSPDEVVSARVSGSAYFEYALERRSSGAEQASERGVRNGIGQTGRFYSSQLVCDQSKELDYIFSAVGSHSV